MLNYFRKKRKKLADDNKLLKYLRYAIGEIVLVMIGILFALQVNNWNSARIARIHEVAIIQELIKSLSLDVKTIKFNISQHGKAENSCEIILKSLDGTIDFNDSLKKHFAAVHYYTTFSSARGVYESIKSRGFESISNNDLKFKIINLYDNWYGVHVKNQDILTDDILVIKREFNPNHFDKTQFFIPESPYYGGEMLPNNFMELRNSNQYKHNIRTLHSNHLSFSSINSISVTLIENLINDCKEEIERLE